jgi:SH3-like domain-containing protein
MPAAPAVLSRVTACFQVFTLLAAGLIFAGAAQAAPAPDFDTPSKAPVPRWAMLRKNEVYARNGPSKDNAKVWTYRVADLPVQIISETKDWRLICDPAHGVAWVSKTMLQAQKTVMSTGRLELRASPRADAPVKAYLRPDALASLNKCAKDWCKLSVGGVDGWAPAASLWGTQTAAVCARPDPFAGATPQPAAQAAERPLSPPLAMISVR